MELTRRLRAISTAFPPLPSLSLSVIEAQLKVVFKVIRDALIDLVWGDFRALAAFQSDDI